MISQAFSSFLTCKLNFVESLLCVQRVLITLTLILSSRKPSEVSVDYPTSLGRKSDLNIGSALKPVGKSLLFVSCCSFLTLIISPVEFDFYSGTNGFVLNTEVS